ncbi:unnamed protein product [Rangifer tarandus platyrhynchus]|uniref:Uncharacterized protein n=1 Tax=Rangifer tarandus platyrhynchus TaxID=3082113 RepID=A0AC59Y292_RANTA
MSVQKIKGPGAAGERGEHSILGTALPTSERGRQGGPESEQWRTPFVSPQWGVRCRLTVPQRRGAEARSGGTGLAAEQGGHSVGKALQNRSPRCRRRRRQQPMPPPRPNHPSDTRAAASQHVGRSRCRNRDGVLGTNTDRTRHKGAGGGVYCDRLARTQIVEAEATPTVVPPEAREGLLEASPDTLCATGSLAPTRYPPPPLPDQLPGVAAALPPPWPAGTARLLRQQLPPAAVPARVLGSRPFPGIVTGRARASRYRRHPRTRQGFGTRRGL